VLTALLAQAARRPVLVFTLLGVPLSWAVLLVPPLAGPGLVPLPVLVLAATWLVLLPAALLVTAAADGRPAVRALLRSPLRWPSRPGRWPVVAALALPVGTLLLALVLGGVLVRPSGGAVLAELAALVSAVLVIHLAEETVWTGVVQRRLAARHAPWTAAVLTALPFAAVHLPLLGGPGTTPGRLLAGAAGLLVLAVVLRLFLAPLVGGTASVLPAALLHGCFNAVANEGRLLDAVVDGADTDLLGTVTAGALGVVALVVHRAGDRGPGRDEARDHLLGGSGGHGLQIKVSGTKLGGSWPPTRPPL
jgi:membrane protease YdiL (CAAX protease family)